MSSAIENNCRHINQLFIHTYCTSRFRVVVRSLAAFLSVQVSSETEIRLQPTGDLQLSTNAQQVCNKNCKYIVLLSLACSYSSR